MENVHYQPVAAKDSKLKEKQSLVPPEGSPDEDDSVERDVWGNGFEFVLACVGFAVGLGNIWRFPYLCYKNGGGAFLVPYFIYFFGGGVPLFFLEVGLGQFMRQGQFGIWDLCPILKGTGIASAVMCFLTNTYYIIVLVWAMHYLFVSLASLGTMELPWTTCDNWWNTKHCYNGTFVKDNLTKEPALEYWDNRVLRRTEGIHDLGGPQWELVGTLFLAWLVVYFCIFKGVKSSGKVVYFSAIFPYVMLLILFIRGVTLPGAADGLIFYLKPDFNKLTETQVWIDAGTQVFYTFACCFGGMTALGSYNKYHRDFVRDCSFIAFVNVFSSLFGGCVIFSVLGYMSYETGIPVDQVSESGPGLVFIVYPKAVSLLPFAPIWAVMFFLMIIFVALDSQFVCVEGFVTMVTDRFPEFFLRGNRREITTAAICVLHFLIGLIMVFEGGVYNFQVFDYYAGSGMVLLSICLTEVIAFAHIYGADRLYVHFNEMTGRNLNCWLKICWKYITPVLSLGLLVYSFVSYTPLKFDSHYTYPAWAQLAGFGLSLSSFIWIPLYFLYSIIKAPGVKIGEKYRQAVEPDMERAFKFRKSQEPNFSAIIVKTTP